MGSCVTEAAQDVGGLHHRPLSATANHLRGPQQQPLVNHQSPHPQHALYSSHHQPQHSHSHLQHQPHPYTASAMGSYSASAGSMQPLSQHHAAPTSQHSMRGHSMSHMTSSSSSSAGSNSFMMDSGAVGYAASPPSSGSSTTMAPPPLLPLPMSLSTRNPGGQQQHQHQHQPQLQHNHQHHQQHQLGQPNDESTNAGFLQQLLHGGMPTDEDLVSVGGASLSLMAATYHGQQAQQQSQQQSQPQQQMGYGSGSGQAHSNSHNPTPASTGTPTNSSEELPCIFDELDMFQENPNSLVSPSCFSHHPATVPPQHHHAGAMEPGSGANHSLQLLTISAAPPLPTSDAMSLESTAGGRRRKVDDLYGDINSVGITNGDGAAAADGVVHGRRGSHPGHGAKRIRYNRSRSASCSSATAVKPEPEEFAAALASSSSSSSSSAAASSETSDTIDLEDIYVGVRDQVVYWGNSKNKYDVTVCVRAPTRYGGLLKGATVSYQVSLPAMQEFKMKSRSGAKGKGKPKAETVKKAVLQLVRTESDNGMVEFEAFLKNCLPTEKLSNLTLLELHFNITPKQHAAMGKAGAEEVKASFNLGSSAPSAVRGGRRKQSMGGDDDDFEDEEDGRESLDEDEYLPTARGRGGRGRGKANGRGVQRGKANHQRDEERESDDPAGGGMDYHQFDMTFAATDGLASIERKVPVVTYTHSKAITRALCRLIWYPMNEENTMSTDFLLDKLCKYFASQLQLPISIYDRHNLAAMLSPFTNGITYVEFYSLLGEWFVLAIKMAKKKTQCLWQQGRETFIPLLFNPYRRINNNSAPAASTASNNNSGGDDDEWTEDNEASSESTRRTGRGRGRRSRSGSRAGLPQPMAKSTAAEDFSLLNGAADVIAALQLDAVLEREGDFLVTIGPDLKERHGRAEGEEGRGVNYFPSLKYPLQIVYVKADGEKQCLSVENKLDKLTDFIHAKQCLRDYLVLQRDGVWKRVEKDQFAFNHAQQRRLEETLGRTSVLAREDAESLSYAHA